jgi:hypothetical protein
VICGCFAVKPGGEIHDTNASRRGAMMRARRDRAKAALVVLLALALGMLATGCESVPEAAKPDVHLVFDIHADGSNTCALEVAIHPIVDPYLRQALEIAEQWLVDLPSPIVMESEERTRDGRKYSALVAEFDSLGDLNAFVNTPHLLSGLVAPLAGEVTIPPLFAEFEVWADRESSPHSYGVNAIMNEEVASALSLVNFTVHFKFPRPSKQHNASSSSGDELSWQVRPGQSLTLEATATESRVQSVATEVRETLGRGATPWIIGGVALIIVAALVVGILYLRARRPDPDVDEWGF